MDVQGGFADQTLYPPRPARPFGRLRTALGPRPRLIERLNAGLDRKLTPMLCIGVSLRPGQLSHDHVVEEVGRWLRAAHCLVYAGRRKVWGLTCLWGFPSPTVGNSSFGPNKAPCLSAVSLTDSRASACES